MFGDPGRGWFPGPQVALPGTHAAKSLVKKGKKRTTMKDVTFGKNMSEKNRKSFANLFKP